MPVTPGLFSGKTIVLRPGSSLEYLFRHFHSQQTRRTFSIWLAMVATLGEPANSKPTATLSSVETIEPESPGADMLVVMIWSLNRATLPPE